MTLDKWSSLSLYGQWTGDARDVYFSPLDSLYDAQKLASCFQSHSLSCWTETVSIGINFPKPLTKINDQNKYTFQIKTAHCKTVRINFMFCSV